MDTEKRADEFEREVGQIVLAGIEQYINIDKNSKNQDDETKSEMKFMVYNGFIDKIGI